MINFFTKFSEIIALMSERKNSSMKLFAGSDLNLENRKRFFEKVGIDKNRIIAAEIVHGNKVEIVDKFSKDFITGADGLLTRDEDVFLSITVADCIPVFIYEPQAKIVGIAHCGWRGILAGVIESLIKKISEADGKIENLKIYLGPGINVCHFEISEDILDKFSNFSDFVIRKDGKIFVDLKGIIKKQLTELGINSENIEDNQECTMENEQKYFSFRRDKPEKVEAMVAVIGIKKRENLNFHKKADRFKNDLNSFL